VPLVVLLNVTVKTQLRGSPGLIRAVAPWAGRGVGVCGIFPHYPYNCYRLSIVIPMSVAFNYRFCKQNFILHFMVQISVCYITKCPFFLKAVCALLNYV
jgi:hypothetical protein